MYEPRDIFSPLNPNNPAKILNESNRRLGEQSRKSVAKGAELIDKLQGAGRSAPINHDAAAAYGIPEIEKRIRAEAYNSYRYSSRRSSKLFWLLLAIGVATAIFAPLIF